MRLSVVIPAAGLGRRMRTLGPKCLLRFRGETLLGRQLRLLSEALPGSDVTVVVGFEGDRVRREAVGCRVVAEPGYAENNVAASVAAGLRAAPPGPALVLYGDLVFGPECLAPFAAAGESCVLLGRMRKGEVGVNVQDGMAHHFCYASPVKWAQMALLSPERREEFLATARPWMFGFEVLAAMADRAPLAAVGRPDLAVVDVDRRADLAAAGLTVDGGRATA